MLFLHERHFPPSTNQDIMGILSYHVMVTPHCGQKERGVMILISRITRKEKAFKKDPQQAKKGRKNNVIIVLLPSIFL